MMMLTVAATAQPLTLDECQQLAESNYPLIRQYDLIRQTTDYNLDNIAKGWLPRVSALAQATLQSGVPALPDVLDKMMAMQGYEVKGMRKDQYRIGVDVSQTIYDGGLIDGQKRVARLEGEVQSAKVTADLYDIRRRVNELYFGILLTDEKIRLNAELQTLLQSNLDKMQSMKAHGVAMQSDVDNVMAEQVKAAQQATELQASRKSLTDMLAVFTGREISGVAVPPEIAPGSGAANRPEMRVFDRQLELFDAQERLLKSKLMPRVSAFAQGYYGYPGYNMYDAMFNRKWTLNAMIGVKVTWIIDGLYTNKNDRARLAVQRDVVNSNRETFLFNNRLLEVQQSEGIDKYRRLIADDRKIVELRGDVRRAAESKLAHGVIDTNNLLREITAENSARIDLSTHTIMMLKESYDLKFTTNN